MADDEGFRRYLAAGMTWFSVTQQKAEAIMRDLADSGETAVAQAQKAFERIVERSRQGSDELRDLVRAEIREQVSALGLASKEDIARLEAKIDAAAKGASAAPPPRKRAPAPKAAPAAKAARDAAGGGSARAASGRKSAAAPEPGPAGGSSSEKA